MTRASTRAGATRRWTVRLAATAAAAGVAAALAVPVAAGGTHEDQARALLRDQQGHLVGVVKLTEDGGRTAVRAVVHGLAPGFHGFHVHETGGCDAGRQFADAGRHLNPAGTAHGAHAGDLPPLLVNADGTAQLRVVTDRFSVQQLLDGDGSSLIVHAAPDNAAHVPGRYHSHADDAIGPDSATRGTGDAGPRHGCGVVEQGG